MLLIRIRRGAVIALPLTAFIFVIYKILKFFADIGEPLPGPWSTDIILVILLLLPIFFLLDLIAHLLSLDRPIIKLVFGAFPSLNIITKIKKGGGAFPEVIFLFSGVYKRAIIMSEEKMPGNPDVTLYGVWEPHPLSLSGELYWVPKDQAKPTGRNGWELIKQIIFGYGLKNGN